MTKKSHKKEKLRNELRLKILWWGNGSTGGRKGRGGRLACLKGYREKTRTKKPDENKGWKALRNFVKECVNVSQETPSKLNSRSESALE